MEDSGDDSEDGDSSDKRVPASRQRGEEQCKTNTQWSDFLLELNYTGNSCGHFSTFVVQKGDLLVMY
jgi:hypothetical protein